MSEEPNRGSDRSHRNIYVAFVVILLLLAGAWTVYATTMKRNRGQAPKLLNQPTEARVVKPFTTTPDKRFAPLKIEREKHEK